MANKINLTLLTPVWDAGGSLRSSIWRAIGASRGQIRGFQRQSGGIRGELARFEKNSFEEVRLTLHKWAIGQFVAIRAWAKPN